VISVPQSQLKMRPQSQSETEVDPLAGSRISRDGSTSCYTRTTAGGTGPITRAQLRVQPGVNLVRNHLVRNRIHHITKLESLPAFKKAFDQALTTSNIPGGFRGSGIYPFDSEAVLCDLHLIPRTPSPGLPDDSTYEPQTPKNTHVMELQSSLLSSKITSHQDFSPSHFNQALQKLVKGAQQMAAPAAMMASQIKDFEKAKTEARRRKVRINKFISFQDRIGVSTAMVSGFQDRVDPRLPKVEVENAGEGTSALSGERRCGACRQEEPTKRTCLSL
jgi:hypothetical protein